MRLKRTVGVVAALAVTLAGVTACRDSREIALGDHRPAAHQDHGRRPVEGHLPARPARRSRSAPTQKQGLDVELFDQPSGANAETSLLAGEVQAVVGFYDHTIDLQAKEQCIQSVVQFANVPGEAEMVATAQGRRDQSPARTSRAATSASRRWVRRRTS